MSTVKLTPDSNGGSVQLKAPADTSGTDVVLTLPANDGDANQVLTTNGSGTLSWAAPVIADDSIVEAKLDIHAAPSGTDKFLGYTSNGMEWAVPSGLSVTTITKLVSSDLTGTNAFTTTGLDGSAIKRITMVGWGLNNDGTSGNNSMMCRIGDSGGLESADYTSTRASIGSASNGQNDDTSEWTIGGGSGGSSDVDAIIFELIPVKADGTSWLAQWKHMQHNPGNSQAGGGTWAGNGIGTKVLSAELDRISFFWANSKNYAHDVTDGLLQLHYLS